MDYELWIKLTGDSLVATKTEMPRSGVGVEQEEWVALFEYYMQKQGEREEAEWKREDEKTKANKRFQQAAKKIRLADVSSVWSAQTSMETAIGNDRGHPVIESSNETLPASLQRYKDLTKNQKNSLHRERRSTVETSIRHDRTKRGEANQAGKNASLNEMW